MPSFLLLSAFSNLPNAALQKKQKQIPSLFQWFEMLRSVVSNGNPRRSSSIQLSLQVLDLSRNQLSFLPGDFVSGAQQLRYLDLSHNQQLSESFDVGKS